MFRTTHLFSALTVLATCSGVASAVTIDFEGPSNGSTYPHAATPTFNGVETEVQAYYDSSGTAYTSNTVAVADASTLGFASGFSNGVNQLMYPDNLNLQFDLDASSGINNITEVEIPYYDSAGNVNLNINEARTGAGLYESSFSAANGATIGGVDVSVNQISTSPPDGVITLNGSIDSFAVGGQEAVFDNIQAVPEPASAALVGLGGLMLLRRRRQPTTR